MATLPDSLDASNLNEILKETVLWSPVGSRVSCNPPPEDSDVDILCLVRSMPTFSAMLEREDYHRGGSDPSDPLALQGNIPVIPGSHFVSFRRDNLNIIATTSNLFYAKFMLATRVATALNLLEKKDRVTLFQAILYENG